MTRTIYRPGNSRDRGWRRIPAWILSSVIGAVIFGALLVSGDAIASWQKWQVSSAREAGYASGYSIAMQTYPDACKATPESVRVVERTVVVTATPKPPTPAAPTPIVESSWHLLQKGQRVAFSGEPRAFSYNIGDDYFMVKAKTMMLFATDRKSDISDKVWVSVPILTAGCEVPTLKNQIEKSSSFVVTYQEFGSDDTGRILVSFTETGTNFSPWTCPPAEMIQLGK